MLARIFIVHCQTGWCNNKIQADIHQNLSQELQQSVLKDVVTSVLASLGYLF